MFRGSISCLSHLFEQNSLPKSYSVYLYEWVKKTVINLDTTQGSYCRISNF